MQEENKIVSMPQLLEDVWNWQDVDPLSLEPVRDLAVVWEYRQGSRRYWYDAVEWLRWICAVVDNQPRRHPVFGWQLTFREHQAIYDACVRVSAADVEKELRLCEEDGLTIRRVEDQFGHLCRALVHARSPLLQARVPSVRSVYAEGDLKCVVDCTATFTALLVDCKGHVVSSRTVYM